MFHFPFYTPGIIGDILMGTFYIYELGAWIATLLFALAFGLSARIKGGELVPQDHEQKPQDFPDEKYQEDT